MISFLAAVGLGTIALLSLPVIAYVLGYVIGIIDKINRGGG